MTFDDFTAILTAVRPDTYNRLDTGKGGRSFVRLFEMIVAIYYFSIGVDVGRKLAEAEQMQPMLPEDQA